MCGDPHDAVVWGAWYTVSVGAASGLTIRILVEDFKVAVLDGPEQLFLVEEVLFESSQRRARLQREHEFRQQCQEEVAAAGLTAAEEEDIRAQIDVLVQSSSSSSSSADTASAAGDAEAPEVPQEHKGDNATSVKSGHHCSAIFLLPRSSVGFPPLFPQFADMLHPRTMLQCRGRVSEST